MASLEEIRNKLQAQQQKIERNSVAGTDKTVYPFWNLQDNTSSEIRFLPDGNPNNIFFWVERLIIKLPFRGIVGESDKDITVQVPCMEMYGKTCPILAETRPWWKDASLADTARLYWKKKSYIFQGFVVKDGLNEKDPPENPIRRFIINPSIYEIIKNSLMDPDMEDLVVDFDTGRDFRLQRTKKGPYADYSTSKFVIKPRPLGNDERAAIEKYGLNDLKQFLPKEPSEEELKIIMEMFHASVNGEPYDPKRWGRYYKPMGINNVSVESNGDVDDDDESVATVSKTTKTISNKTTVNVSKPVSALAKLKAQVDESDADNSDNNTKYNTKDNMRENTVSTNSSNTTFTSDNKSLDAAKILDMIRSRKKQ